MSHHPHNATGQGMLPKKTLNTLKSQANDLESYGRQVLEQRDSQSALNSLSLSSRKEAYITVVKVVFSRKRPTKSAVWSLTHSNLLDTTEKFQLLSLDQGLWKPLSSLLKQKVKFSGIFCVISVAGWRMNIWGLNCSIFFYPELAESVRVGGRKGTSGQHWKKGKLGWKAFCLRNNENNPGWNLGCEESRMRHAKHIKWNFHYLWKLSGAWRTSTGRKDGFM